jgi:hypothetical protein
LSIRKIIEVTRRKMRQFTLILTSPIKSPLISLSSKRGFG